MYYKKEIIIKENYFKYCYDLKQIHKLKKKNNPKISIISPIYNREKFISRFIGNIQKQSFKDIEIILVDDNSIDNSVKLIEKYKKEDKRIKLIKNKKNRGTFVARNLGALISKSKYLILPDPDDMISKDIIGICYKYGEKYNYDLIRFNLYLGKGKVSKQNFIISQKSRPIYQPELSSYMFYGNIELEIIDNCISNKFIKRKVYIKSLNSLKNSYLNMHMIFMEDTLMNYLLLRTAKSFYFLKIIGYNYIKTVESITKKIVRNSQKRLKSFFIFLNFIFKLSKNTKYEKDIINFHLTDIIRKFDISKELSKINCYEIYYFYYEIINTIINCLYISDENLYLLLKLKKIIEKKNKTYF